jgi:SAM-dependent methyltransferase
VRELRDGRDDGRVSQADELLSPAGTELLRRLQGLVITPARALSLAEELRGSYPPELIAAALTQRALRTAAQQKFSRADDMLFTRPGLEQASSELTAEHSARRFAGDHVVADLCCGIGGNLIALAVTARRVVAVDADRDTLRYAGHNAAVHGLTSQVALVCADVRDFRLPGSVTAAFIDPARRLAGRRLRAGDSEPPLSWCLALAETIPQVCIKAAPGLPHDLVPPGWETEFVATGRALKEALLWSPAFATTARRATILPAGATLVSSPGDPIVVGEPGEYLLDPNPAVTRAGLVQELGRDLGARQLDELTAFLSLDRCVGTPFARTLRVIESMPWHERQVARRLRELGVGAADIRRRGLAGDVERIRRRLGLQGDRQATIVLTRRAGRPWSLICETVPGQAAEDDPEAPR